MHGTIDLEAVRLFVQVAEEASFRAAAEALAVPRSTVSRRILALEDALGARLLMRTTRKVTLTEAGSAYLKACRPAMNALDEAWRALSEGVAETRGRLRVTAPVTFGEGFLGAALADYAASHPRVSVEVVLTDRYVDLIHEGFDVAFRTGAVKDTSLVARELGRTSLRCFASRAYLGARGVPRRPRDLARHDAILFSPLASDGRWTFRERARTIRVPVAGRLQVNSLPLARDLALRGLGVVRLPGVGTGGADGEPPLVEVLARYAPPSRPVYVVHPSGGHASPRGRAFIELATKHLVSRFAPPATPR